jgi:O-acetyl-ADP-ribose deacetylase (regulator of RNase III)
MYKEVIGDLIKEAKANPLKWDVIVHDCNCFSTMGAGIARAIKKEFPEAYDVDKADPRKPKDRLGSISHTLVETPIVVNAYTQYDFKGPMNASYPAIQSAMKEIKQKFSGKKIAMPLIGAGLAGGDWDFISQIIQKELANEDVTIVIWDQNA